MKYEYHCPACKHVFDVIKRAAEMTNEEKCEKCQTVANRQFVPSRVWFNGTKVQHAEYNPGLGCVTRNKEHRAEIAKRKGLEEIGNESPDKIGKQFEKQREDAREKAWTDADKGWVGDGSS